MVQEQLLVGVDFVGVCVGSRMWGRNSGNKGSDWRLATAQSHGTPQNFYRANEDIELMVPNILHVH